MQTYAPENPDHPNHESVTCAHHHYSLLIKENKLSISSHAHHKASYVCIIPIVMVMSIRLLEPSKLWKSQTLVPVVILSTKLQTGHSNINNSKNDTKFAGIRFNNSLPSLQNWSDMENLATCFITLTNEKKVNEPKINNFAYIHPNPLLLNKSRTAYTLPDIGGEL